MGWGMDQENGFYFVVRGKSDQLFSHFQFTAPLPNLAGEDGVTWDRKDHFPDAWVVFVLEAYE